jgi:hypothetical protein
LLRHAHIKRALGSKGEAARRIIQLHGGHADIEHDPVQREEIMVLRQSVEITELARA